MEQFEFLNEALSHYGMECSTSEKIRHNENMTYCIDGKYLLRIHKSKPGFCTTSYYDDADMIKIRKSELRFLDHLREHGLPVQTVIRNVDHQLVTKLKDGTIATMLSWIPGRIVEKNDLTDEFGYEMGKMVGKMHMAAKGYRANYAISYDKDLCQRSMGLLTHYFHTGKLEKKYCEILLQTFEIIGEKLKQSGSEHILVHSDLSLSNILITENGLVPIDFSLLGYSNPLLDMGSVFCFASKESCRSNIISGYEKITGCQVDRKEIDVYFALQILLGIILHYEIWMCEEWFVKRLPEWCNETFVPLINDFKIK